jgi:hypothetical protein
MSSSLSIWNKSIDRNVLAKEKPAALEQTGTGATVCWFN